jgi:hypothetical protein
MYFVHPITNEHFFLHLLFTIVPDATSYEHLWAIYDTKHLIFQAICGALGLLQDDTKWDTCMWEACIDQDAKRLGNLLVTFLLLCSLLNLEVLWERY